MTETMPEPENIDSRSERRQAHDAAEDVVTPETPNDRTDTPEQLAKDAGEH